MHVITPLIYIALEPGVYLENKGSMKNRIPTKANHILVLRLSMADKQPFTHHDQSMIIVGHHSGIQNRQMCTRSVFAHVTTHDANC